VLTVSKHIRISEQAYQHLQIVKKLQYTNPRFSIGDAVDKIIQDNEKLKQQNEWLMKKSAN
jgi:hypothetical protein